LVNFLIFVSKITPFSKKDVDEGNTPPDIYKLCVSIREAFCISYYIRKENNLFFYIKQDQIFIKFIGNELRYLGSDERSQALLFSKVLNNINQTEEKGWIRSTPGIYAKKFKDNEEFLNSLNSDENLPLTFILEEDFARKTPKVIELNQIKSLNDQLFLIPSCSNDNKDLVEIAEKFTQKFPKELDSINLISFNKVKTLGDKILYVNFQIDQQ